MRLHAKFLRLPLRSAPSNDMARVSWILAPEAVCLFRELARNNHKPWTPWTDALERLARTVRKWNPALEETAGLARATAKASEGDIAFTDTVRERYKWR